MARGFCEFAPWLAAAIRADAGVAAFCTAHSWPLPAFVVGEDERETVDPAGVFPRIVINCGGRGLSQDSHLAGFQLALGICCKVEAEATTTSGVTSFPGYALAEEFLLLVADAIANAGHHSSGYYVHGIPQPGPADRLQFPYIRQWLGVNVEFDSDIHA